MITWFLYDIIFCEILKLINIDLWSIIFRLIYLSLLCDVLFSRYWPQHMWCYVTYVATHIDKPAQKCKTLPSCIHEVFAQQNTCVFPTKACAVCTSYLIKCIYIFPNLMICECVMLVPKTNKVIKTNNNYVGVSTRNTLCTCLYTQFAICSCISN